MDKSREQFEAWLESEDGKALMAYSDNHTIAEAAWQASRAAVEIELPDIRTCCSSHIKCKKANNLVCDAITKHGLKVKQ